MSAEGECLGMVGCQLEVYEWAGRLWEEERVRTDVHRGCGSGYVPLQAQPNACVYLPAF